MSTESITPGELRGLSTFLCSIRDDWQAVQVRGALEKLQGYSLVDVAEVCTEIARNRSNQFPVMLAKKGVEQLLMKQGKAKSRARGQLPDKYMCDVCGKVRSLCMSSARSADGDADHTFISAAEGDADRDEKHADGRMDAAKASARADAIKRATGGSMFALPRDVADIHIPTDPQEKSA